MPFLRAGSTLSREPPQGWMRTCPPVQACDLSGCQDQAPFASGVSCPVPWGVTACPSSSSRS